MTKACSGQAGMVQKETDQGCWENKDGCNFFNDYYFRKVDSRLINVFFKTNILH